MEPSNPTPDPQAGIRRQIPDDELNELIAFICEEDAIAERKGDRDILRVPKSWLTKFGNTMKNVGRHANRERKETIIAARILRRYVTGKEPSKEELKFLKDQSIDIMRILPIVAAQAVPAPVPITPFLLALGKRIGIDMVPKEQVVPEHFIKPEDKEPSKEQESFGAE